MLPTLTATTALIRHRRSIKPVDMDPARDVDRALLVELIENATWAPNHGLTEPWKFHVFQGASRHELTRIMQDTYTAITPAAEFREDKRQKMAENPLLASVVIACVMERGSNPKIPEIEEIEALASALQNLQLSAAAAGLGSYWSSPPLLEAPMFHDWLGLRGSDRCMGLIYLGWPKPGLNWPRSVRQPVDNKIVWH
jgi:nitroreductase